MLAEPRTFAASAVISFPPVLANLASTAVFALGSHSVVRTNLAAATQFANSSVISVFAYPPPLAIFACGSNPVVLADASTLALPAARLGPVVNAIISRRGTLSAEELDLVVRADIRTFALPANTPTLVVMAEDAATASTTLHLQPAMAAPGIAPANFARSFQCAMLTNARAFAFRAGVLLTAVRAKRSSTAVDAF